MNREPRRFLTVAQAATLLGVSNATLYREIKVEAFPAIMVRNRYVIPMKAIDQMEADALEQGGTVHAADYVVRRRQDEPGR